MRVLPVVIVVVVTAGCMPPFAEMQGARLTGPGRVEVTPHLTRTSFVENGEMSQLYNNVGVAISTGLGRGVDLRVQVQHSRPVESGGSSYSTFGLGPKFSLVPDRVAFYVPIGFGVGDGLDIGNTLQTHPTILFSTPLGKSAEFNASVKALLPLANNDADVLIGATFGLALGKDVSRWAIRPEIAFLRNPGETGTAVSAGIGLTLGTGPRRARAP